MWGAPLPLDGVDGRAEKREADLQQVLTDQDNECASRMDENQRQMKEIIQKQDQKFDAMFEEHRKAQTEEMAK